MESCKHCNSTNLHTQVKSPHMGLYCGDCGRFQRWVKQEINIENREIASEPQQKYALSLMRKWEGKNIPLTLQRGEEWLKQTGL